MWTFSLISLALATHPVPASTPTNPYDNDSVAMTADTSDSASLLRHFSDEIDTGIMAIVLHTEGAFLQFTDNIEYRTNKARRDRGQRKTLDLMAEVLARHPQVPIQLIGHADDRRIVDGRYTDNDELSMARALDTKRQLMRRGITAARIGIIAEAAMDPAAANAGVARDLNRRVEVRLLPAIDLDAVELEAGFGQHSNDAVAAL